MGIFFLIFSLLLIVLSLMPFIKNQHWVFRVSEFIKIQLFFLQIIAIFGLLIFAEKSVWFWPVLLLQIVLLIYHAYLLSRFTQLHPNPKKGTSYSADFKIVSANIYQFNQEFERFKDLIKREDPDAFMTIESNKDWEHALRDMEKDYPYTQKVTLENTYGMHLYARVPFEKVTTHFFVSDDIPCIEAHFKTTDGTDFVIFGVHPPPPSPTEEENSKERDGDLLCIAKRVKAIKKPVLVIGDFNTVSWSKVSRLFRKNSELMDGRNGRGILATFHAKYWFFRAPLDLVFHSATIFLNELNVLEYFGSDHFPIRCSFCVDNTDLSQKKEVETIDKEERKETEEMIKEGKKEQGNNRNK